MVDSDYFICKVAFAATEESGEERRVEFSAEFANAEKAMGFRYDIRGVFEKNPKGGHKKSKSDLNAIVRTNLNKTIETAAYAALETTTKAAATSTSSPPEGAAAT